MDLRYDEEKVKSTWNFINKVWNASRFVLMKLDGFKEEDYTLDNLKVEDKWILDKLNSTIKDVTKHMDKYDFNLAGNGLQTQSVALSYVLNLSIFDSCYSGSSLLGAV
jgi:valyl-tRNA synthetase